MDTTLDVRTKIGLSTSARAIDLSAQHTADLLRQMWETRLFEKRVYDLLGKTQIKGASHLHAGEEAVDVGAISVLRDDDWITTAPTGAIGYFLGRGGSLHIADVQKGNLGATGIVGGNIPVATGAGLAQRMMKKDIVVMLRTQPVVTLFQGDHQAILSPVHALRPLRVRSTHS